MLNAKTLLLQLIYIPYATKQGRVLIYNTRHSNELAQTGIATFLTDTKNALWSCAVALRRYRTPNLIDRLFQIARRLGEIGSWSGGQACS